MLIRCPDSYQRQSSMIFIENRSISQSASWSRKQVFIYALGIYIYNNPETVCRVVRTVID